MLTCQLKVPCADCKDAYISVFSELGNGRAVISTCENAMIFCKHQKVCSRYNNNNEYLLLAPMRFIDKSLIEAMTEQDESDSDE